MNTVQKPEKIIKVLRELETIPNVMDEHVRKMWCGKAADALESMQAQLDAHIELEGEECPLCIMEDHIELLEKVAKHAQHVIDGAGLEGIYRLESALAIAKENNLQKRGPIPLEK